MNRLTFHENDSCSFNIDQDFSMEKSKGYWLNNEFDLEKSICKLGQLEDIEEELGIDLTILFKALKDGVYVKAPIYKTVQNHEYIENSDRGANDNMFTYIKIGTEIVFIKKPKLNKELNSIYGFTKEWKNPQSCNDWLKCDFKDFGKTWALTRDELEKGAKQ